MAFTKKAKATPKPASYARKSKKHTEPIEEHEEQEEVETESDYEDAPESEEQAQEPEQEQEQERPSRGYSSNNYARPSQRPQGNRSYGAPRRNTQSQDGKGVRVTGLFAGKREGLWTGRLRKEDIENLMGLFDSALNNNQLITMFLWENQDGPQFSLTANVAQEFKGNGGGGRFNRGYRGSIGRR